MRKLLAPCLAVYWIALTLWCSALVAAGVAAMNVFGTLPDMSVRLPDYARFPESEHGRIAAGQVMANVFLTVDMLQYVAAPLVIAMLALQVLVFRAPLERWSNVVRTAALVAAALLLAWYAVDLAPRMNELLAAYWQAAQAGALDEARTLLASFDGLHRRADGVYRIELVLLLTAIAASAAAERPPQSAAGLGVGEAA